DADAAANVGLTIQNGTLEATGPAITVAAGNTSVYGCTLLTTGDAPTVAVAGGPLFLLGNTNHETPAPPPAGFSVTGGSLGLTSNYVNVNGTGWFLDNSMPDPVFPSGDTFEVNGAAPPVIPVTFTVTNAGDEGPGSLRQAIFDATASGLLAT